MSTFEFSRKMPYKEEFAFDLGYKKALGEIEKLKKQNAELKRLLNLAILDIKSMRKHPSNWKQY